MCSARFLPRVGCAWSTLPEMDVEADPPVTFTRVLDKNVNKQGTEGFDSSAGRGD